MLHVATITLMADDRDVVVCISGSRLSAMRRPRSLARNGLLIVSLLAIALFAVYVCSPEVIGQAARVLKSAATPCSHDESKGYLQELVSVYVDVLYLWCV